MAEQVAVAGSLGAAPSAARARWMAWARRGGLSILDQGFFAGANFVLNIMLARWLPTAEYGAFTLAYSVFLFAGAFYLAWFMEPFLIFAAGERRAEFGRYLALVLRWHWRATSVCSALAALVAVIASLAGHRWQGGAFAGLALALPFLLQLWLMRTVFYARTQPQCAAMGSALFFALQVGGILTLQWVGWLRPLSAFLVSGAASCAAGFAMRALAGHVPRAQGSTAERAEFRRAVLGDHLGYAKWATGVSVIAWLCSNVHYFILTSAGGLAAVGAMKVLDNLMTPFYQCISALGQLLLPVVSSRAGDRAAFIKRTAAVAGCWFALAIPAYAALFWLGPELLRLLFGPGLVALAAPLRVYALVVFPYTLAMALMLGCRAKVRTDLVFVYHLLFGGALTTAYLVARARGLDGMVWANVTMRLLFLPVIVALFMRAARQPARAGAGAAG